MTDLSAIELHHEVAGPPDAPPLLLLNSLGTTLEMWGPQIPALTGQFRVIRCDTRGHGLSPVPPAPYSVEDLAGDALALLDRLGIERAHVVGLSLGGMVAMNLAARAPERVDRLALLCTSALLGPPETWDQRVAAVRAGGTAAVADAVVARWLHQGRLDSDPTTVAYVRDLVASTPAEGYVGAALAVRDSDRRADLARITAPTLVIAGAEDPSTPPEHLHRIAEGIAGSRLVEIPACAHLATIDQPEAVTAALLEHFGTAK